MDITFSKSDKGDNLAVLKFDATERDDVAAALESFTDLVSYVYNCSAEVAVKDQQAFEQFKSEFTKLMYGG